MLFLRGLVPGIVFYEVDLLLYVTVKLFKFVCWGLVNSIQFSCMDWTPSQSDLKMSVTSMS